MSKIDWRDGGSGFVTIHDKQLEYACYGENPEDAPTLVLLHEGLGCVSLWKDIPRQLADATGLGVFVYSRFGYGKSDECVLPRDINYMTEEALNVLPKVLQAIDIRSGILFGHSDGATIAAIHAGFSGDLRVRGIVLMAPHFFAEPMGLEAIEAARDAYDAGDLREKLARHHRNVECAFRGWNDAWLNPEFADWNVSEAIDYLRVPVLAIQGEDDQYGSLKQIQEIENRIYSPLDTRIFKNCGHSPHIEKRRETLEAVTEFVERLMRMELEFVATG